MTEEQWKHDIRACEEASEMEAILREAVAAIDMEEDTVQHNHEERLNAALDEARAILARINSTAA
jgi:hypothetical protein